MTDTQTDSEVPSHETLIAESKEDIQQCFDVVSPWKSSGKLQGSTDDFRDKEEIATHILLRLTPSRLPIGTIRAYLVPGTADTYKLTRLALLKDYRKYGFGRELVHAFHDWVKSHAMTMSSSQSTTPDAPHSDDATNGIKPDSKPRPDHISPNDQSKSHQPLSTRQIKIHCHSQIYAKGFYSKFGYVPEVRTTFSATSFMSKAILPTFRFSRKSSKKNHLLAAKPT
ncbi:hypothetical protein NP233_g10934 [Leucocoprinus birnbaumii]|uniref:N-acetyltransferase domain-containing protein n=1 Tax=Leucocoprinus birnbaumii TaxID=56174 RepID=A0AAD5YPE5_9AGAR|nr:hypothetical protein NP233_g10934 [Leucocoprinus birnbaumii]